jgi:hypothetical protein
MKEEDKPPVLSKLEQLRAKYGLHSADQTVPVAQEPTQAQREESNAEWREARMCLIIACLDSIWASPPTTKSDWAREYADEIAEMASKGFITTQIAIHPDTDFGRVWKITLTGLTVLTQHSFLLDQEQIHRL